MIQNRFGNLPVLIDSEQLFYIHKTIKAMNYQLIYDHLILSRKERIKDPNIYYEIHHIILRSMGGSNLPDNLVSLTAREHFIAHWLLWRIYRNKQTAFAFYAMCSWKNNKIQGKERSFSSRGYAEAREALSKVKWTHSKETKCKISEIKTGVKLGPISNHRSQKLKQYFIDNKYLRICVCNVCGNTFEITKKSANKTIYCSKKCASSVTNKNKRIIEVINKTTYETFTFESISKAAKELNINRSIIYSYKEHPIYKFKII
jgi:hypothetical protein